MKKTFLAFILGLASLHGQAQVIYWSDPLFDSEKTKQTGIVANSALGIASIIGQTIEHTAQIKAQKEANALHQKLKAEAKQNFPYDIQAADAYFKDGDYSLALQAYAKCAHNNDNFEEDLGDQDYLVARIAECNKLLGTVAEQPCVINNFKARKADYSEYTVDIESPVYKARKLTNYAQITRVSCNGKETRIEFEYFNPYNCSVGLGIKGNTYIKGKKSGKLALRRMENITISPARTMIPYGRQTLKFALIFPALNPQDETFNFVEPSSDWKFNNVICR